MSCLTSLFHLGGELFFHESRNSNFCLFASTVLHRLAGVLSKIKHHHAVGLYPELLGGVEEIQVIGKLVQGLHIVFDRRRNDISVFVEQVFPIVGSEAGRETPRW
jgi:hypothetical protein